MKKFYVCLIILAGLSFGYISCKKDSEESSKTITGTPSPIGEKGTNFTAVGLPSGFSNTSAVISNLSESGVSTLKVSAEITNHELLAVLNNIDGYDASIKEVSGNFRVTSEGAESVYNDGTCTLVKYDAKVGDIYRGEHNGMSLKREVMAVSSEDDFYWNGMLIKTIKVKETGRNIPGLTSVEHIYNHRFGLVGVTVYFEDGSSETINVISSVFN